METIIGAAMIAAGLAFMIAPSLSRIGDALFGIREELEHSNVKASELLGLAHKVDRAWAPPRLVNHRSQYDADLNPEALELLQRLDRTNRKGP
jgi:hypothetical protein